VHGDGENVSTFAIAKTGLLNIVSRVNCGGRNPVHLAMLPGGKNFAVANYASGCVSVLPIQEDGTLGLPAQNVGLAELLSDQSREPHPHQIVIDPNSPRVIVPDKGSDRVFTFSVGDAPAPLALCNVYETARGAGPRHLVFHDNGSRAFLVNELDSTISALQYDPATGKFATLQTRSAVPTPGKEENLSAAIVPLGMSRIAATNRGQDSIATFTLDTDGLLGEPQFTSPRGKVPRFAAVIPGHDWLCVANEATDTIEIFDFSGEHLAHRHRAAETGSPVCVIFSAF
jgi:6-phosphogluconolactonase